MRRAFTLIEVLIAAAVFGLIMSAAYSMFVQGARLFVRGQARTDLQSQGMLALCRLTAELERSALATLTVSKGPPVALAFRDLDPTAPAATFLPAPVFTVYYYDSAGKRLVRKTWGQATGDPAVLDPSPLAEGRRMTFAELAQVATTVNQTERTAASMVEKVEFSVGLDEDGNAVRAFPDLAARDPRPSVSLVLKTKGDSEHFIEETVTLAVAMRNRL